MCKNIIKKKFQILNLSSELFCPSSCCTSFLPSFLATICFSLSFFFFYSFLFIFILFHLVFVFFFVHLLLLWTLERDPNTDIRYRIFVFRWMCLRNSSTDIQSDIPIYMHLSNEKQQKHKKKKNKNKNNKNIYKMKDK